MRPHVFLTVAAIATLTIDPMSAFAQSARRAPDHWNGWASLSLGPGTADGRERIGGMLALWATRGDLALSLRDAGASRLLEPGDVGDFSILAGLHSIRKPHIDGVILAGIGESSGHGTAGENLARIPVVAASAQLNFNFVVVGLGLDAFAGIGDSRRYGGVGLALALGWFQ
jgi:hypothetical protein